jgi:hypothetical protein
MAQKGELFLGKTEVRNDLIAHRHRILEEIESDNVFNQ